MSIETHKFNLKHLPFSPTKNPLLDGFTVNAKRKQIRTGGAKEMIDPKTGEVNQAIIIEEHELDEIHFVKVFTAGITCFNGGVCHSGGRCCSY